MRIENRRQTGKQLFSIVSFLEAELAADPVSGWLPKLSTTSTTRASELQGGTSTGYASGFGRKRRRWITNYGAQSDDDGEGSLRLLQLEYRGKPAFTINQRRHSRQRQSTGKLNTERRAERVFFPLSARRSPPVPILGNL